MPATESSVDPDRLAEVLKNMEYAETTLRDIKAAVRETAARLTVPLDEGLAGLEAAIGFLEREIPRVRRRYAMAQSLAAEEGAFDSGSFVLLDDTLLSTLTLEEAEARAQWLAEELLDIEDGKPSAELVDELRMYANDPYVASALAKRLTPEEIAQIARDLVWKPAEIKAHETSGRTVELRRDSLRENLGIMLGTATRQTAADLKPPDDYAERWIAVITDESWKQRGGAAAELLRHGVYGTDFLVDVGTAVYAHEQDKSQYRAWDEYAGTHGEFTGDVLLGLTYAFAANPDAGQRWLTEERIDYLVGDRRWKYDDGEGLGRMLEAVTTFRRSDTVDGRRSAELASMAFKSLGETLDDDRNGLPPKLRDHAAAMLTVYMRDAYRVVGSISDGDIPGTVLSTDFVATSEEKYGAKLLEKHLELAVNWIGEDPELFQTLIGGALLFHGDLLSETLIAATGGEGEDSAAVQQFRSAGVIPEATTDAGVNSAELLGFLMKHGIKGDIAEWNEDTAARAKFVSRISTVVDTLGVRAKIVDGLAVKDEGWTKFALDQIYNTLVGLPSDPGAHPEQHSDDHDGQVRQDMEKQLYNSLLATGYLDAAEPPLNGAVTYVDGVPRLVPVDESLTETQRTALQHWLLNEAPQTPLTDFRAAYSAELSPFFKD